MLLSLISLNVLSLDDACHLIDVGLLKKIIGNKADKSDLDSKADLDVVEVSYTSGDTGNGMIWYR